MLQGGHHPGSLGLTPVRVDRYDRCGHGLWRDRGSVVQKMHYVGLMSTFMDMGIGTLTSPRRRRHRGPGAGGTIALQAVCIEGTVGSIFRMVMQEKEDYRDPRRHGIRRDRILWSR